MSQEWTSNSFASGHVAQTDLQNMEKNFACLKSGFSGAAAPANTEGGMRWFDTTKKVFKIRNNGDTAWYGLMHGDVNEKRIVYRAAAMDGYLRDATVTDKVIALRGGTIYVAGGATAGTFTIATANLPSHTHQQNLGVTAGGIGNLGQYSIGEQTGDTPLAAVEITGATGGADGNYRPAAAVCILVYLDL